jgi:hypothetical protein
MNTAQNVFLKLIDGIITTIVIYLIVSTFLFNDFFTLLQPGWHTTICPFGTPLILTIIILVLTLITYLAFKYALKIIIIFYPRFF